METYLWCNQKFFANNNQSKQTLFNNLMTICHQLDKTDCITREIFLKDCYNQTSESQTQLNKKTNIFSFFLCICNVHYHSIIANSLRKTHTPKFMDKKILYRKICHDKSPSSIRGRKRNILDYRWYKKSEEIIPWAQWFH